MTGRLQKQRGEGMTDYDKLAERGHRLVAEALKRVPVWLDPKGKYTTRDLAKALNATLARLEAAEKVCEAVENMRGVSLDLKTALGLEHKVHEALDAWREAKSS